MIYMAIIYAFWISATLPFPQFCFADVSLLTVWLLPSGVLVLGYGGRGRYADWRLGGPHVGASLEHPCF